MQQVLLCAFAGGTAVLSFRPSSALIFPNTVYKKYTRRESTMHTTFITLPSCIHVALSTMILHNLYYTEYQSSIQ